MKSPIIVALDFSDMRELDKLVAQLDPAACRLKVGKELFTRQGPSIVEKLQGKGFEVFLDLKFHDIPNTTAQAVRAAADMGVWMVNIHAAGGRRMMEACREALDQSGNGHQTHLIAVTILTSLAKEDLAEIGFSEPPEKMVSRLAALSQRAGMDGVVCSAQEAPMLAKERGREFMLVTPGIRPSFAAANDQTRIVTPAKALADGSHFLVIGRPITQAEDPMWALEKIMEEIAGSASGS